MSSKNRLEQDLPPNIILEQMLANSNQNFEFFSELNINKEYIFQRKNILNILHKLTNKMGFKSQVFFLSIHYLDIIFSSNKNIKLKFNIYALALACFCLSAKFCEIDPIVPELYYFIKIYYSIIGFKIKHSISLNELKYAEVYVLRLLNYKLNYHSVYDFNSFLFIYGIIKSQQRNSNYKSKQIMEKIYKKSRYFLDIVVIHTKLCFKYDAIFLSIIIIEKSIDEVLNEEKCNKNICFKEIMINIFNFNYENNKQYQSLIIDEEVIKIFDLIQKDKIVYNNKLNKGKEEKKEFNDNIDKFNKTVLFSTNNKINRNFALNKIKDINTKIDLFNSLSKDSTRNKTFQNFYSNKTMKNEIKSHGIATSTVKNNFDSKLEFKLFNKSMEKNPKSHHKIIYSKYTYNSNKYKDMNMNRNNDRKNKNSSVENKNKNINLGKYIITSQKKSNNFILKNIRNSFDDNKIANSNNLYQKKLIQQNTNENNKTINSFMDELRKTKITYGVLKINSNEPRKESSIEYKNKNDSNILQKDNFFKKINYNKLINNIKIDSYKNKEKNNNYNRLTYNKIVKSSKNRLIFLNNINNFRNENESTQILTTKYRNSNILKDINISKRLNDTNITIGKDKTYKNFNAYKYQKNKTKTNQTKNLDKENNTYKNKLSVLLGKQNTNLNNTLKEINIALSNNTNKNKMTSKDNNIISTLPNKQTRYFFQTQKDYFHNIKQEKRKEEIIKNQQDKRKESLPNNNKHEKFSSSTILVNNNINFNIENKFGNNDIMKNNVYKKNKISDIKAKKYFNINNRNTVNGFNDTFYKTQLYTNTLENVLIKKIF